TPIPAPRAQSWRTFPPARAASPGSHGHAGASAPRQSPPGPWTVNGSYFIKAMARVPLGEIDGPGPTWEQETGEARNDLFCTPFNHPIPNPQLGRLFACEPRAGVITSRDVYTPVPKSLSPNLD